MIGRKTKGGFVITSRPPPPSWVVTTRGDGMGVGDAAGDSDASGVGDGEEAGVGVGEPCSVKLAHGFGGTLAHSRWTPGESPGKGVTPFVKAPLESAVTLAATWLGVSQ